MKSKDGFSLVEILVVIAIIGVLSSILISSLNSARTKANDAAIKQQLSDLRPSAELALTNTGTYNTVCDTGTKTGELFRNAVELSDKFQSSAVCIPSGVQYYELNDVGQLLPFLKSVTPGKWAAVVHLYTGNFFCVDYLGNATTTGNITISEIDADCR